MGLLDKLKSKQQAKEQAPEPAEVVTINPPDGTPMDERPEPEPVVAELPLEESPNAEPLVDLDLDPAVLLCEFKQANAAELLDMHSELVSGLADNVFSSWEATSPLALWHAEGRSLKRGKKPKKPDVLADMEWLISLIHRGPLTVEQAIELAMLNNLNPLPSKDEPEPEAVVLVDEVEPEAELEELDDEEEFYDMPPTLYIGCIPRPHAGNKNTVGKMVWLEDYLKRFQEQVAESRNVPHYRLVEYATGEKEVAALVHHELRNRSRPSVGLPSCLIADRRVPGANAVLEVLVQHYPHIVERLG